MTEPPFAPPATRLGRLVAADITPPFGVRLLAAGGDTRVVVDGEADCAVAERLRQAVDAALASAPARLVLDLRATTFVDSSCLAVLLQAKDAADARGIDVVLLARTDGPVARLLTLCSLTDHFGGRPTAAV